MPSRTPLSPQIQFISQAYQTFDKILTSTPAHGAHLLRAGHLERRKTGPRFCRCDVTDLKLIWGDEKLANYEFLQHVQLIAACILHRFLSPKYVRSFGFHLKHCFFTVFFQLKKTAGRKSDALEPLATKGVRSGLLQIIEGGCPVRNFKQLL